MSEDSDGSFIVSIVDPQGQDAQGTDVPALSDLSDRDKVWDKHRENADKVARHYSKAPEHRDYSQRVEFCSQWLDFRLVPEADEGLLKLKLAAARFCRVRHCPVCQWRRSLMWKAKAYQALPKIVADYPKHRWLFLTLTLKNCPIQELRETLSEVNKAFVRLTKLKVWPAEGWIKSVEVTRGRDGNAHPHLHILLMVPPAYFGRNYINQEEWSVLWQKCLRIDYKPMVHVRAIAKTQNPTVIIPEILKYQVKESDLIADSDWFLELTKQLHKTRAVAVGGVLRHYMKELEQEPEDLVGEDGQGDVDEGHLYFAWKKKQKKYRLADS